jgi:3-methyladenine DNA glycosylase AlkC
MQDQNKGQNMVYGLKDVHEIRQNELNQGAPSLNLMEQLSTNFQVLWRHTWQNSTFDANIQKKAIDLANNCFSGKILNNMQQAGDLLDALFKLEDFSCSTLQANIHSYLQNHSSDTVRGWLCYAIAKKHPIKDILQQPELFFQILDWIKPLAADQHFGVREWAWLAIRQHWIAYFQSIFINPSSLKNHLNDLNQQPFFWQTFNTWVQSNDENIRRFMIELTRPKGVWCKQFSDVGLFANNFGIYLTTLAFDPSLYVRKSVANWLNDLFKIKMSKTKTPTYLKEYQLILNQIQVKIQENMASDAAKKATWTVKHAQRSVNH